MRACNRHVTGVIGDTILLLVRGFMLFIDHDQAQVGKGQEKGRPRPHDHARLVGSNTLPGTAALCWRHFRMPKGWLDAEPALEAFQELCGQ